MIPPALIVRIAAQDFVVRDKLDPVEIPLSVLARPTGDEGFEQVHRFLDGRHYSASRSPTRRSAARQIASGAVSASATSSQYTWCRRSFLPAIPPPPLPASGCTVNRSVSTTCQAAAMSVEYRGGPAQY